MYEKQSGVPTGSVDTRNTTATSGVVGFPGLMCGANTPGFAFNYDAQQMHSVD